MPSFAILMYKQLSKSEVNYFLQLKANWKLYLLVFFCLQKERCQGLSDNKFMLFYINLYCWQQNLAYFCLHSSQIKALIGQSAMGYCASKPVSSELLCKSNRPQDSMV